MEKQDKKRRAEAEPFVPDQEETPAQVQQKQLENDVVKESGSIIKTKGRFAIHCLTIIGQVEGHFVSNAQAKTTKYEHVLPQLVEVEEDPEIHGLLILLNTVGGDVEAGLAIAELIAGMSKPTASLVLGGGHSIGIPLAVSAKRSFIVPSATMTVHPVRHSGTIIGVPQTMSYLERMQDRIIEFVTANSRITKARFEKLMLNTGELVMDVGSVLNGELAVKEKLIDELGSLNSALKFLYSAIEGSEGDKKIKHAAIKHGRKSKKA